MKRTLPEFDNPPLIEVAVSIQFEPIKELSFAHLGLLWDQYRDHFPKTQQHQRLPNIFEKFGQRPQNQSGIVFEISNSPSVPDTRLWFMNRDETELIQVQQDRFVRNWRKAGTETAYPRYEKVRQNFITDLDLFTKFLQTEKLGEMKPNQCELTYVNHILPGQGWQDHSQIANVLSFCNQGPTTDLIPEETRFDTKYIISDQNNNPCGRLHISSEPAYRRSDNTPIFILRMTARGYSGSDQKQLLAFFDRCHEYIVRFFTAITTEPMHQEWGRAL